MGKGWKYFLVLFKATNRRNYAIGAFHTLASIKVLPPRLAHQMIWSRTINTHTDGKPGHNIPCDLYIEHINRSLKQCIHNLHANKTEKAIHIASKSMGPVNSIIQNCDQKHSLYRSDAHSVCCSATDRDVIIKELRDKGRVFALIPGRSHQSFSNFVCNPVKKIKYDELIKWLKVCANNIKYTLTIPDTS